MVILAGYTKEMELFLGANSGLASRFPPTRSSFPTITGEELYRILLSLAKGKGYTLDEACREPLTAWFTRKQAEDAATNGNGRMAPQRTGEGHPQPVPAAHRRPRGQPGTAAAR